MRKFPRKRIRAQIYIYLCHRVLHHCFAHTIDSPPYTTSYSPPPCCPAPWSRVVLHFHARCKGEQYDRIAAIWIAGAEILRTSTAEPTADGIFLNVRKDVTRYSSLFAKSNLDLTMMLENIVNTVHRRLPRYRHSPLLQRVRR